MAGEEIASLQPGEYARLAYEPDARDLLFDDLSHGRIEPAQAEERARELGLSPLNPALEIAQYDPLAENFWTLAMAVAWIAWRDIDRVRDELPSWRRDNLDWFHREYRVPDEAGGWTKRAGWILERVHKGEAPFMFLALCEAIDASEGSPIDPAMRLTIRAAREQLWQRLGDGELAATTAIDGAGIVQIAAHEWAFLEHGESGDRDVLYVRNDTWRGPKYAGDVLISRKSLLTLWPGEVAQSPIMGIRELIRQIADEVATPGMRATNRNDAIRKAAKARNVTPPSDTTIKDALKGTSHIRSRKRQPKP